MTGELVKNIWLIGTGLMGREYAKVLTALNIDFIAVGRGEENAIKFEEVTKHPVIRGGLEKFIAGNPEIPSAVIVAVKVNDLFQIAKLLLDFGIKNILLEKPGVLNFTDACMLEEIINKCNANIFIAYNRRFYSSVLHAEKIIREDGGVTSFHFEFTEWSHIIEKLNNPKEVFKKTFLCNSTHVVDTAFFLGGKPEKLYALHTGGTKWHPASSVFAGAGESKKGALFSYLANWEAPGRWAIEILTKKHRLYLKPMETLQIQELASVNINSVELDDMLDKEFKPGLYLQTKAFLDNEFTRFLSLQEQKEMIEKYYLSMSGYDK